MTATLTFKAEIKAVGSERILELAKVIAEIDKSQAKIVRKAAETGLVEITLDGLSFEQVELLEHAKELIFKP